MKLVKEFLIDKNTLWLVRFTLLSGLFLSAFNDISGYFFLIVFVGWYIAVMILDNHFPTNSKDNLLKGCITYKRPERFEIVTTTTGEIDPLFEEDMTIPFLQGMD